MSNAPTARTLRATFAARIAAAAGDQVERESLRVDVTQCAAGVRRDLDRAIAFAERGLRSELLSIVEDHPDLVLEVDALVALAESDPAFGALVSEAGAMGVRLPDRGELDQIAAIATVDAREAELANALRIAVLRREPVTARIRILRRLRDNDPRNRVWLDQLQFHEQAFLRELADMRDQPVSREILDQAIALVDGHDWVTHVPRGLKEELLTKVRPLRALEAEARFQALVADIHAAAALMDRKSLLDLEAKWAEVHESTGQMPSDELQSMVAPAFQWLTDIAAEEAAQAEQAARIDGLGRALGDGSGTAEIARLLAQVLDAGMPAPEGLVARARAVLLAEEERLHRRSRLIMLGSIAGAAVLCIVGFLAIQAYGRATRVEREAARLGELVAAKDVARAHALAEEIRARGENDDARITALLAEEAALYAAREARVRDIHTTIDRLTAELGPEGTGVSRARLGAIDASLVEIAKDADDSDRSTIAALQRVRVAALERLDAADGKRTDEAVAAVAGALREWPVPTRWTDAEQLDLERWKSYLRELETRRGELDEVRATIAGYEPGERRLETELEGLEPRRIEAEARLKALTAASADLQPIRLGAPFGNEQAFVDRLARVLTAHGPVLARRGQLAEFEAAQKLGGAWLAVGAWRDSFRPRLAALLGRDLAGSVEPASHAQIVQIAQEYLGAHPESPLRPAVERLVSSFDPNAVRTRWSAQALATALANARLADIEIVRIRDGRAYYRRPNPPDERDDAKRNPLYRALKSLPDLLADPTTLSSMHVFQRSEIDGGPVREPVSQSWGRALDLMSSAREGEEGAILLEAAKAVAGQVGSDPILRVRALRDLVVLAIESGCCDDDVVTELAEWRDALRSQASQALGADWVLAAYKPRGDFENARREAEEVLRRFPDLDAAVEAARAVRAEEGSALAALAPLGVLLPPVAPGGERVVQGVAYSGSAVLVVRTATGIVLQSAELENGRLAKSDALRPLGPVIIYRKVS
jgi:hypothetical protein